MKNRTKLQKTFIGMASICIPLAVGGVSAALTADAMAQFGEMNQPPLSPPGWLFPVAWAVLYVLMGIACYLLYMAEPEKPQQKKNRFIALCLYAGQLFFNFCWSPIFFKLGWYYIALIWLLAMWGLILALMIFAGKVTKTAAFLLIPYLCWTTFAGYLNAGVAVLN